MSKQVNRLARTLVGASCALALVIADAAPSASASGASVAVTAGPSDAKFGWRVPVEQARLVTFANSVANDEASTVLTLKTPAAPTTFAFPLSLPAGSEVVPDGLGGYDLLRVTTRFATALAHLDAPWARDARGHSLPTTLTVDGNTLIQAVDTRGATFPVTADPHYTWGWVTGTIYFNKHETKVLTAFGTAASFISSLGGPWALLLRGYVAYLVTVAGKAIADGKCLKVKSTLVASEYSGGYCQ